MNRDNFIRYTTTSAVPYNVGQTVKRVNNCCGFFAVNTGDDIAFVNDQILYPGTIGTIIGDSMTVSGNIGEIYLGNINIRFNGVGANPEVVVTQKTYIIDGPPII